MDIQIVGTLKNAKRIPKGQDLRAPCLAGNVYGDTKGRFPDGTWITTSTIMEEDGDVFRTRFSVYRVESWADGTSVAAAPLTFEAFTAKLKSSAEALLSQAAEFKATMLDLAAKVDKAPADFPKHLAEAELVHQVTRIAAAFDA